MNIARAVKILENNMGREIKYQYYTGSEAVAISFNPAVDMWALKEVRYHSANLGASGNMTIAIDSGEGSVYDTKLYVVDMTSTSDIVYQPSLPILLKSTDNITITWTNAGTKTYGIELIYSNL